MLYIPNFGAKIQTACKAKENSYNSLLQCMKCHVIFTKGSCSIEQLYVVALEVVAEHKKKSTCMGASVPESVGERRQA